MGEVSQAGVWVTLPQAATLEGCNQYGCSSHSCIDGASFPYSSPDRILYPSPRPQGYTG